MKKQELIHLHGLLAQVQNHYEERSGDEVEHDLYEMLGVRPTSLHRSKTDHRAATLELSSDITGEMPVEGGSESSSEDYNTALANDISRGATTDIENELSKAWISVTPPGATEGEDPYNDDIDFPETEVGDLEEELDSAYGDLVEAIYTDSKSYDEVRTVGIRDAFLKIDPQFAKTKLGHHRLGLLMEEGLVREVDNSLYMAATVADEYEVDRSLMDGSEYDSSSPDSSDNYSGSGSDTDALPGLTEDALEQPETGLDDAGRELESGSDLS